ncbi:unnamed protein product [Toxocara canis]|uniref:Uncharacterized protein n=1 Tax=Toxocara canis TaxID=6265 RepID=A0A183UIS5_TOXCA|nr:unnamed protein product [Toxocara canis]
MPENEYGRTVDRKKLMCLDNFLLSKASTLSRETLAVEWLEAYALVRDELDEFASWWVDNADHEAVSRKRSNRARLPAISNGCPISKVANCREYGPATRFYIATSEQSRKMVSVRTEGDWRPGQQEIGWKEAPGGGETIRGVEDPTRTDLLKKTQQKKRERDSRARTTSKCWRTKFRFD